MTVVDCYMVTPSELHLLLSHPCVIPLTLTWLDQVTCFDQWDTSMCDTNRALTHTCTMKNFLLECLPLAPWATMWRSPADLVRTSHRRERSPASPSCSSHLCSGARKVSEEEQNYSAEPSPDHKSKEIINHCCLKPPSFGMTCYATINI